MTNGTTPKELVGEAMRLGEPSRVPVLCQLAIGHTLLQTGCHPVDYLLDSEAYARALLRVRERYRFDGVLLHKPGREAALRAALTSMDRDAETPVLKFPDGARIRCPRNDDPEYVSAPGFARPEEAGELDPDDPLGWAPASFRLWCRHKGTADLRDLSEIPEDWYGAIDRVAAAVGGDHSVHGEVRSPLDHLFAILGLQPGMMALLLEPEKVRDLLQVFTRWTATWAEAQVRRGCDAVKISSPYAGASFLSRAMYREFVIPSERPVAEAVRRAGGVAYTHTCGAIGDRLDCIAETGVHGIEALDPPPLGTVDLAEAKKTLQDRLFIKGNVNPVDTLLKKSPEEARRDIEAVFVTGRPGGGFILSSACSIAPRTPPENVEQLAACVYDHAD